MDSFDGKIIVGSEEWCSFPDAGLPAIKARVDSGAATSALHATNIVAFDRDGQPWVSFEVHDESGRTCIYRRGREEPECSMAWNIPEAAEAACS